MSSSSHHRIFAFIGLLCIVIIAAYWEVGVGEGRSPSSQMAIRLIAGSLAAGAVIAAALGVEWMSNRANRITQMADVLATTDAVSVTTASELERTPLDDSATAQPERDGMQGELRKARREIAHLSSVLETIPDGVIVLDTDGRAIFVNETAKVLLNGMDLERSSPFSAWIAQDAAQTVIEPHKRQRSVPGLYALGDPRQVEAGGRILRAQMAELRSIVDQQVGMVILLRDITNDVRRDRAQAALLERLQAVQTPIAEHAGRTAAQSSIESDAALRGFSREMMRHAAGLQRLIVEMRDLTVSGLPDMDGTVPMRAMRPIPVENLVWTVANEWRQVAAAAEVRMDVQIEVHGLVILGDERRLRWALGNLMDNAIKYTLPGGACSLEMKGETDGMARLRVRDNGVGIAREELDQVYIPFYRGTPKTRDGEPILAPGIGQGLSTAKAIMEAHGGTIRVQSVEGSGTAVSVALPLTAETPLVMMDVNRGETLRMTPIDILLSHFAEAASGDDDGETRMIDKE